MTSDTNLTMGRILARAWSDAPFKARLLADPKPALGDLGISLADGPSIVARENTADLIHLTISAPPIAVPISAHSEIRDFAETYRDPCLWPLLRMQAALEGVGAPHRFVRYRDRGHMFITEEVIAQSRKFIADQLAGA